MVDYIKENLPDAPPAPAGATGGRSTVPAPAGATGGGSAVPAPAGATGGGSAVPAPAGATSGRSTVPAGARNQGSALAAAFAATLAARTRAAPTLSANNEPYEPLMTPPMSPSGPSERSRKSLRRGAKKQRKTRRQN